MIPSEVFKLILGANQVESKTSQSESESINLKFYFSIVINVKKVSRQKNKSFYHMIEKKRQRKLRKIQL